MAKFFYFILILVVCFLSDGLKCEENPKHMVIKLNRQKTPFEQHINNANFLKKYGIDNIDWLNKKHHHHKGDARTNDSIALMRYIDNEFYGTIVIGHPGKTLNVAFDTSWALSWVMSDECGWSLPGCWFHNKYNHAKSTSYKPDGRPLVIPEGNFNISGYFSFDNISISHSNVTNFSFVEMTEIPYTFLFSKVDGVLGLGLRQDSYEPFFYALVRQGKIANKVFSVYLNRDKQSSHGGNIILGFIEMRHVHSHKEGNNKIYDVIKYMPVKASPYWEFDLDTVYVNIMKKEEKPLVFCNDAKCTAITDTSSNNIMGPRAQVDAIHKAINAKHFLMDRYFVDCDTINKLPVVEFTIGGQNFTLKGRDYTIKISYFAALNLCLSAFVPADYTNFWVLGGAFLSEYYTIYNLENKQIGIVKAA